MRSPTGVALLVVGLVVNAGSAAPLSAQGITHATYVEAGGSPAFEGGAWTVNYELGFGPAALRAGVFAGEVSGATSVMVPLMFNILAGGDRHHLELGVGTRLDVVDETREARLIAAVGWRRQAPGGGLVLRAGGAFDLGPAEWSLYPMPALSVGWAF